MRIPLLKHMNKMGEEPPNLSSCEDHQALEELIRNAKKWPNVFKKLLDLSKKKTEASQPKKRRRSDHDQKEEDSTPAKKKFSCDAGESTKPSSARLDKMPGCFKGSETPGVMPRGSIRKWDATPGHASTPHQGMLGHSATLSACKNRCDKTPKTEIETPGHGSGWAETPKKDRGGEPIQETPTPRANKRCSCWEGTPAKAIPGGMTPSITPGDMTPTMTPGGGTDNCPAQSGDYVPEQTRVQPTQAHTESLGNRISHLCAADIEPDSEGVLQETILSFAEMGRTGKWANLADRLNQLVTFSDEQNYQKYLYYFALAVTDTTVSKQISTNFQELVQGLEKTRKSQLESMDKLVLGTIGLMGITLCADRCLWKNAYTLLGYLHDKEIVYTNPIVSKPIPMFKIVLTVVEVCLAVGEPLTVIDAMEKVNWFETNELTMERLTVDRMRVEMLLEVLRRLQRAMSDMYVPIIVKEKIVDLLKNFYLEMTADITRDVGAFNDIQSYKDYVDHNHLLNELYEIAMEYRHAGLMRALLKAADVYAGLCKFRHKDIRPIVRFFYRLSLTKSEFFKDACTSYKIGQSMEIYPSNKKFDQRTGGILQLWFTMSKEEMHLAVEHYLDRIVMNWVNLGKSRTNCSIRLAIHLVDMPRSSMAPWRAYKSEMDNPCSKKVALDKVMDTLKKDMNPPLSWSYNDGIFHINPTTLLDALYPKLVKFLTESNAQGDPFNLPIIKSNKMLKRKSVVYGDFQKACIVTTGGSWKPTPTINECIPSVDNLVTPGPDSEQLNKISRHFGNDSNIRNLDPKSQHSDTFQDQFMEIADNQDMKPNKRPSTLSSHSGESPDANLSQMLGTGPRNLELDHNIPRKRMSLTQFIYQSILRNQPAQEEELCAPPSYQFRGQNQPHPTSTASRSPFNRLVATSTITSQSANAGAQRSVSIDEDCMDTDLLLQESSPFSAPFNSSLSSCEPKFLSPSRLELSSAMPRQFQQLGPDSRHSLRGRMSTHHHPPLNRTHWVPQEHKSIHEQFNMGSPPSHNIASLMDLTTSQGFQPVTGLSVSIQGPLAIPDSSQQAANPERRVVITQSQQYPPDATPISGLTNNTGNTLHSQVCGAISDRLGQYIKNDRLPGENYSDLIDSIASGFYKEDIMKRNPEQKFTNTMFAE